MKNNLLRIIIGLITIGLLAGCTAKPANTTQTTSQTNANTVLSGVAPKVQSLETFQSCVKTSINACAESSTSAQAKKDNDASWCNLIADEKAKKSCQVGIVYSNALKSQDESKCADIPDNITKNMCRSQIVSQKAMKEQNIAICDTLQIQANSGSTISASGSSPANPSDQVQRSNEDSDRCRLGVLRGMGTGETPEKMCTKMITDEGKKNCQEYIKMTAEREAEHLKRLEELRKQPK